MNKIRFKDFILNENKAFLANSIGDILNAVHDIDDGSALGIKQLMKFFEKIVARIRRILHSNWPQTEHKHLQKLQKIGVAIMNAIEQKDDLKELLPSIRSELEQISADIGMPVNYLGNQEETPSQLISPEGQTNPEPGQEQGLPPQPQLQ